MEAIGGPACSGLVGIRASSFRAGLRTSGITCLQYLDVISGHIYYTYRTLYRGDGSSLHIRMPHLKRELRTSDKPVYSGCIYTYKR